MVRLQIHLHLIFETEVLKEPEDRSCIEIVLVGGGFFWLRLHQNLSLETYLVLVVDDESQKPSQLLQLLLHIRVEQRFVPFASAPENIVCASQSHGDVHTVLHSR